MLTILVSQFNAAKTLPADAHDAGFPTQVATEPSLLMVRMLFLHVAVNQERSVRQSRLVTELQFVPSMGALSIRDKGIS